MTKLLLDTNAYARLARGDEELLAALADADVIYLSVFVLGELIAGFRGGRHEAANRKGLKEFLKASPVKLLLATEDTAERFGILKDALKRAGTPLPINDVWIAAHALETGATLVTWDGHFDCVAGLRRWPPTPPAP